MALTEAFTWGRAGAKLTPEEIARQREIADALLAQAGDTSPVGHWSEGAARVVNALGGVLKERRANAAEKGNTTASQGRIAALLGGLGGQGASPVAAGVPVAAGAPPGSAPAPVVGENADYIRSGLLKRGLPEHVADAFVLNFQDESGLNPGINEANPTVPGSRGGYGLYQLTGPRRRAYEEFAQQRGVAPDDVDAQLDFMMAELQGPESAAAKSILSAPDTGTAAAAIVNNFLRPAESHRASRVARYTGGGGGTQVASLDPSIGLPPEQQTALAAIDNLTAAPSPGMGPPGNGVTATPEGQRVLAQMLSGGSMTGGDPMALQGAPVPTNMADRPVAPAVQQVAQALPAQAPEAPAQAPGGINPAILESLSSPYATPQERQIAGILLEQQMQNSDPMRQLQMQKLQRELTATPERKTVEINGRLVDATTGEEIANFPAADKPPAGVQEYEYARSQGFPGSYVDWEASKKGGMSLQVDPATGAVTFQQGQNIKPLTEGQSKDTVFATRAEGALPLIDQYGAALTNLGESVAGQVPGVGNYMKSKEFQQAEQAGKEFLQAILRKDTGAAITSEETSEYGTVYLPRPGDSPELLEQKKASRARALEAIKAGMPPQALLYVEKALANERKPKAPVKIDGYTIEEVE